MSGPTQREVDEAVARAFGHAPRASTEADRASAAAFGREVSEDAALRRDLEEAGMTKSGARGVVRSLAGGMSVSDALTLESAFGVQPGRIQSQVFERAAGVVRRHRGEPPAAASMEQGRPGVAVEEARARLEAAYRGVWPLSGVESAQRYAKSAMEAWLESGARRGLSESEIVAAIDGQRADVLARGRGSGPARESGRRLEQVREVGGLS